MTLRTGRGSGDLFKKPDYARLIVNDVPIFASSVGTHGTQVAIKIENVNRRIK